MDQKGDLLWEKILNFTGGSYYEEEFLKIIKTSDGNFLVAGINTKSSTLISWDLWLLKIDKEGNIIWEKNYGLNLLVTLDLLEDQGIILACSLKNSLDGESFLFLKLDENGNIIWHRPYGNFFSVFDLDLSKTEKGTYLASATCSTNGLEEKSFLLEIDKEGNILWYKNYEKKYLYCKNGKGKQLLFGDFMEIY